MLDQYFWTHLIWFVANRVTCIHVVEVTYGWYFLKFRLGQRPNCIWVSIYWWVGDSVLFPYSQANWNPESFPVKIYRWQCFIQCFISLGFKWRERLDFYCFYYFFHYTNSFWKAQIIVIWQNFVCFLFILKKIFTASESQLVPSS